MINKKCQFPNASPFTDKEIIVLTTAKIWMILNIKGMTSILRLKKLLKEKDTIVHHALKLLIVEGKITSIMKGNIEYFFLTDTEIESDKLVYENIPNNKS
jgi:ribosomal protein L10